MKRKREDSEGGVEGLEEAPDCEEEELSEGSDDEVDAPDNGPDGLSDVGQAALDALSSTHAVHRGVSWQVTHGKIVGEMKQTPRGGYFGDEQIGSDIEESHSDFFPEKMGEIIARAEAWVDITTLGPPTGKFIDFFAKAFKELHDKGNSITVRILFGNIVGMPTDCDAVVKALFKHPDYVIDVESTNLRVHVGSWRKGVSWNHAKIIAVDGKYLFTGGHNLWDDHYLKKNPVRDLSVELEGQVSHDGHVFANKMWKFTIKKMQQWQAMSLVPDWVPMIMHSRCNLAKFPQAADDYPPMYEPSSKPLPLPEAIGNGDIPLITCGRLGGLHIYNGSENPSDNAIVAMLKSAQASIKMSLQDLGPIAIPTPAGLKAIPGGVWPEAYLREIGLAMYQRGVNVQMVLSNPNSIPANLGPTEANYGNGWTCNDVASEIVKAIQASIEDADEEQIRGMIGVNLQLAFLRTSCGDFDWAEAKKGGNHAKFFIIDDKAFYCGSQNLYICNLAEWGIIVDNEEATQKVIEDYWNNLWGCAFKEDEPDFDVNMVMDGLGVDRLGPDKADMTDEEIEAMMLAQEATNAGAAPNNLSVWLKDASGLKDSDGLGRGSSDSYVKFRLVDGDGNTVKGPFESKVIPDGGPNPKWNQVMTIEGLKSPGAYTLKLSVLDKDSVLGLGGLGGEMADSLISDDKLGSAQVNLGELQCCKKYQMRNLIIVDGWFQDSTLTIGLNTEGNWGN
mmetsp:Transcript_69570/g.137687  ORF Transcript_69570/g.137687 Transcript_69570/m.137687 type:complete len:730 (+) Transcript_69570:49-2238(+)